MSVVRVALVGCGNQSHENLLPSMSAIPEIELVAVCDVDPIRAKETAMNYGCTFYTDAMDMLKSEKLDAVLLAGPPEMHLQLGIAAMERRLHLFVEKPAAVSLEATEALLAAARRNRVITMVGHNFRHASAINVVKDMINKGIFSTPRYIHVRFLANKPRSTIWNLRSLLWTQLMMMAVHPLDLMQHFMGEATHVYTSGDEQKNGVFLLTSMIQFESGAIGVLYTGSNCPRFEVNVELSDASGQLVTIDNLWNVHLRKSPSEEFNKLWSMQWQPSPLNGGFQRSGYATELNHFVQSIRQGTPAQPSLETYWHTMRLCYAIELSLREKRTVAVTEIAPSMTKAEFQLNR